MHEKTPAFPFSAFVHTCHTTGICSQVVGILLEYRADALPKTYKGRGLRWDLCDVLIVSSSPARRHALALWLPERCGEFRAAASCKVLARCPHLRSTCRRNPVLII